MQTRPRDVLWLVVALVTSLGVLRILWAALTDFFAEPSLGKVLGLAVLLLVAFWIVGGSWLRTKWGAPIGGVRRVAEERVRTSSDG